MDERSAAALVAQVCRAHRAAAWGWTTLDRVRTDDFLLPGDALARLRTAVSVALPLLPAVLDTLTDRPTRLYEHHYRQVNFALDRLGLALGRAIEDAGFAALPVPASQLVDWDNQRGHLSHKRIAVAAGVGRLGRSNLVVTPRHGAQVRLVTVLTGLPLAGAVGPGDDAGDCGDCRACIEACPCGAIGETAAGFDHRTCFEQLREFQRRREVSQYICGRCVRACPGSSGR